MNKVIAIIILLFLFVQWQETNEQQLALGPEAAVVGTQTSTTQTTMSFEAYTPVHPAEHQYVDIYQRCGTEHGIDPALLAAIGHVESRFDPEAVSHAGAQGMQQFMPATAAAMGVNPWDPESAICGTARYLNTSFEIHRNWSEAIAAYNAGDPAVSDRGVNAAEGTYTADVMHQWDLRRKKSTKKSVPLIPLFLLVRGRKTQQNSGSSTGSRSATSVGGATFAATPKPPKNGGKPGKVAGSTKSYEHRSKPYPPLSGPCLKLLLLLCVSSKRRDRESPDVDYIIVIWVGIALVYSAMGSPVMSRKRRRKGTGYSPTANARVSPEELAMLDRAAEAFNASRSDVMRTALVEWLERNADLFDQSPEDGLNDPLIGGKATA